MPDQESYDGRLLIDKVVYLASLASKPHDIDPILDPLRVITARDEGQLKVGDNDLVVLKGVQSQLEDYLIHREPLRQFNTETLKQSLFERFEGGKRLKHLRYIGVGVAIGSIGGSVAAFLFSSALKVPPALVMTVATISLNAIMNSGTLWLFIQALKSFNPLLRKAYGFVAASIAITALTQIHLPFVWSIPNSLWVRGELFTTLFTLTMALMYIAFVKVAKLLEIKTSLSSLRVLLAALALSCLVIVLPHGSTTLSGPVFAISVVALVWTFVFMVLVLLLGRKIIAQVNELYSRALKALLIAIAFLGLGSLMFLIGRLIWVDATLMPRALQGMSTLAFVLNGVMYLRAGYLFNRISRY